MNISPLTRETVLDKLAPLGPEEREFLRKIQGDRDELPEGVYEDFLRIRRGLASRTIRLLEIHMPRRGRY